MRTGNWGQGARVVALLALAFAASGCRPQTSDQAGETPSNPARFDEMKSYNLTIHSYNYTDSEISHFEVNGQGGGNVEVSEQTAGGGKSTCCVTVFTPFVQPQSVTIKWNRVGDIWCEQDVLLVPPLPAKPEYFEAHFYRDGHIEVAVTSNYSPAREVLAREHGNSRHKNAKLNVNNDDKFSRCKLGH
jgi:hypothetical protein